MVQWVVERRGEEGGKGEKSVAYGVSGYGRGLSE